MKMIQFNACLRAKIAVFAAAKPHTLSRRSAVGKQTSVILPSLLMLALVLSGCGSQPTDEDLSADDTMLNELMGELDGSASGSSNDSTGRDTAGRRKSAPRDQSGGGETSAQRSAAMPVTATAAGERLELRLQQGDRFPLIKTIEQTLVQKSQQYPAVAQTRLELTMAIQVEQVRSDAILLSVRYSRVAYAHDLNGQRLEYDSAVQQSLPPHDVQPYAGMVNNGFAFWLGRNNRIRELVGYQEFLQRCVEQVPVERRQSLLAEISQRFGDDGVANFIDDSIGLLPYDDSVDQESATRVIPGDVWTRETRLMQPAPIYLTSTYRLISLDARTAEIDITGRVASGETVAQGQHGNLRITGGHSTGKCTVDRVTGLPLETNLTRFVSMVVRLPDGQEVPQDKQIVTRIRAFPETRGPVVMPTLPPNTIQPAAASGFSPVNTATPIPTRTSAAVPGRAVYPD